MSQLVTPPSGEYLRWVIEHPEQVAAYLETVRALQNLTITVNYVATKPTGTRQYAVRVGPQNAVVAITV
jgi:hypothetical protein